MRHNSFSLLVLRVVERRMSRIVFKFLTITADGGIEDEKIEFVFKSRNARIVSTDYEKDIQKAEITYIITISLKHDVPMKQILDEISAIKSVRKVVIKG